MPSLCSTPYTGISRLFEPRVPLLCLQALLALSNATLNGTSTDALLAHSGAAVSSSYTLLDSNDAVNNGQRRRRLQGAPSPSPAAGSGSGDGCVPINIYQPGAATLAISTVTIEITLPASLFAASPGTDASIVAGGVRTRLLRLLANSSAVQQALGENNWTCHR